MYLAGSVILIEYNRPELISATESRHVTIANPYRSCSLSLNLSKHTDLSLLLLSRKSNQDKFQRRARFCKQLVHLSIVFNQISLSCTFQQSFVLFVLLKGTFCQAKIPSLFFPNFHRSPMHVEIRNRLHYVSLALQQLVFFIAC